MGLFRRRKGKCHVNVHASMPGSSFKSWLSFLRSKKRMEKMCAFQEFCFAGPDDFRRKIRKFKPTNVTKCWYFGVSFLVRKFGALCFWKSWKEDVFAWSKKMRETLAWRYVHRWFLGTIKFPQWLLLQDKSESIRVDDWNYYPTHPPETGAYDLVAYVTWYAKHERN